MKRILITRTDRMGDVILSTPVFRAVREEYPDSHIAVLVRPYTRDCVEGNPYIDEVIIYDKHGREKDALSAIRFAQELRKKHFDTALILHPTNRMNLITFLAGIPQRVGYNRKCGFLLTKKIRHTKRLGEKHELEYALDVIRAIGINPKHRGLYMPLKKETQRAVLKMFSEKGVNPGDVLIGMHPSASCPSKRWLPERFAKTADTLAEEYGAKIVLVSDEPGRAYSEKVKEKMKHASIDLSGKTTISELGAVLARCALFISNDSGPVHLASAVGTPVIAIFGRSDAGLGPICWGPTGKYDIILHKKVGCGHCLAHNCRKGFLCLEALGENEVVNAAKTLLEKNGGYHDEGNVMQEEERTGKLS